MFYLPILHKSPLKPASHPVKHVPLVLEHWFTSRHWPQVSLHPIPNDPLSHSAMIKYDFCMFSFYTKDDAHFASLTIS